MTWLEARLNGRGSALPLLADYFALTKPGIVRLVLVVTALAFYMGSGPGLDWLRLGQTLVGTALAAAGAGALNQVLEREPDALMRRTRQRPLPAGRLRAPEAAAFGLALSLGGVLYLALVVNALTALLAALTLVGYLLVYTPLKRRSSLCTFVGAVPGAVPVMAGWAAARGTVEPGAWLLLGILFLWQLPHFLALGWLHREDYAQAGFQMLTLEDPNGRYTAAQALIYTAALVPLALWPAVLGLTRPAFLWLALLLGLAFLAASGQFLLRPSRRAALALFRASLVYLPLLLGAMALLKA